MNETEHGFCPTCYKASVQYVEVYKALLCTHCNTSYWDIDEYNNSVEAMHDSVSYAMWEVGHRRRALLNSIWDTVDPPLAHLIGKLADGINRLSQWVRELENENE